MADPPKKRLLYIALIGLGAVLPLAMNPEYGGVFSLASLACVMAFIQSDRQRDLPGFPVIFKGKVPE